jgi:hypothetical protein
MVNRTDAASLYEQALSLAEDAFDTDDSRGNADKVCAVALHVVSDTFVALFSGAPGYNALVKRVAGNSADAKRAITDTLTSLLRSEAGGGFTPQQINQCGFDPHGSRCNELRRAQDLLLHQLVQAFSTAQLGLDPLQQECCGARLQPALQKLPPVGLRAVP